MNMKFLLVVKLPPAIYHGYFTWKTYWEENFAPVKMASCGRQNVRKHREISNGDQYISLDISLELDCM